MAELESVEKKLRQYGALAESYNLGTLYCKVLDHMSKNPSHNSEKFAEACKELDELYFEDFVVPVLETLDKTFDEMPDTIKINGATFYKNPEIDYKIIPTLFNVKPSAGRIDKDTSWKRGTPTLKEWKDSEEEREKRLEKKIMVMFKSLDMIEKSEDYKRVEQELAVLQQPTTVAKKDQYEPLTDENMPIYDKHESVIAHFNIGTLMVTSYKWLIENLPRPVELGHEVKKVCEKMIKKYDENFIEPCLGVYDCPSSKREMGEPVANKFGDTFNLHPSLELDATTGFLNIYIEKNEDYEYSYSIHLGQDKDDPVELGEWIKGQLERYETDYSQSVDYLKKNLVELAMIDAE